MIFVRLHGSQPGMSLTGGCRSAVPGAPLRIAAVSPQSLGAFGARPGEAGKWRERMGQLNRFRSPKGSSTVQLESRSLNESFHFRLVVSNTSIFV